MCGCVYVAVVVGVLFYVWCFVLYLFACYSYLFVWLLFVV